MGECIAVLSGKGGTGKTSICAGIASALAQEGKRVLCIDCDVGLRNLDISLGLSEVPTLSFVDISSGNYLFEQVMPHPKFPTLWFLTAPVNVSADEIGFAAFASMIQTAKEKFDFVFLDSPAGMDAGFRLTAQNADRIFLVTGSDPASVRDAGRVAQKLELMGRVNVRLIVNRVNVKLISALSRTIDDIMDDAGLPLMGVVPEDVSMVLAAAIGKPLLLYTRRGAAAACKRIAKRMQGLTTPITL